MYVDPNQRAQAARLLLDGVVSLDLDDHGTDDADARALLALQPLGLDLENSPAGAAALAASLDLLWFLTAHHAKTTGVSQEELISNVRAHVLPHIYPDVLGGQ